WLALLAIQHRQAIYARARTVSLANLELMESAWSSRTDRIAWTKPRGGFTVFPMLPAERDTRPLCERLGARGILVVPGDCFGMPSHIRIGFGTQRERSAEAFDALRTEVAVYLREERRRSTVAVH